ncbi:MAG: hypothetical protein R3F20_17985 [Planctomycetota bacterium]
MKPLVAATTLLALGALVWFLVALFGGGGADVRFDDASAKGSAGRDAGARRSRLEDLEGRRTTDEARSDAPTTEETAESSPESRSRPERRRSRLRLRLVDEGDLPLAEHSVWGHLRFDRGGSPYVFEILGSALRLGVTTDADGVAEFLLPDDAEVSSLREVFVEARGPTDLVERCAFVGDIATRLEPRPDVWDLGVATVPYRPVIASGRVVDERGEPVGGVSLMLRRPDPTTPGGSPPILGEWLQGRLVPENGNFVIRGHVVDPRLTREERDRAPTALEIAVDDNAHAATWTSFRIGDSDLEIVAARRGRITVTVVLPDGLPPGELRFGLESPDSVEEPDGRPPDRKLRPLPADGRIEDHPVDVGTWRFFLVTRDRLVAGSTSAFPISAGSALDLGRLVPTALRVYSLTATDGEGRRLEEFAIEEPSPTTTSPIEAATTDGNVRFASARETIRMRVSAIGCLDRWVDVQPGDTEIALSAGPTLRVRSLGAPPPLESGDSLRIVLVSDRRSSRREIDFPAGGESEIILSSTGRWSASIFLHRLRFTGPVRQPLHAGPYPFVAEPGGSVLSIPWGERETTALRKAREVLDRTTDAEK